MDRSQSSLAPTSLEEVLSPAWLNTALEESLPGVEVASTLVTETLKTVATKVRFNVAYRHAPPGAPPAFCVKGSFDAEGAVRSGGTTEANFYRDLASSLPVRVPPCFYTGIDATSGHSIIVMEDLVSSGSTFLAPLSPYGLDQAEGTLDQMAQLHASAWGRTKTEKIPWLKPILGNIVSYVSEDLLQQHLEGPRGAVLPKEIKDAKRLNRAMALLSLWAGEDEICLIHGDVHAGNVFETGDGSMGLVDWQVVQPLTWALDVAYHLGAVLDTDSREKHERELLSYYLERLAANGVNPPSEDKAWRSYRIGLLYGYYLWAITRMVEQTVILEFTTRLGTAVAAHDSFGLLGAGNSNDKGARNERQPTSGW